jgi:tRNA pseudouridine55 synthase
MDGVLVVDKPGGKTSHDIVDVVRKASKIKKVGHTGTLDPMATGVLVLTIGKATRIGRFLELEPKEYIAEALFGVSTNTQDVTGEVLQQSDIKIDEARLRAALPKFTGETRQVPPMVSAIKVGGKPLYKLARQGKEIERAPRDITVYEIELLEFFERDGRMRARLRVLCSGGTYVRTLVSDLGDDLGVGATLAALRRTRVGRYSLSDARGLEELKDRESISDHIIDMAGALDHLAAVIAKDSSIGLILNGREINRDHISEGSEAASGFVRLMSPGGKLLAIGLAKADPELRIKPEIVFG